MREVYCPVLPKKLSTLKIDEIKKFIDIASNKKSEINSYKSFKKDFDALYDILKDKKDSDIHNVKVKVDNCDNILYDDLDTVINSISSLKSELDTIRKTLSPLELMFGTSKSFEVVNKEGNVKTIEELLKGKSHLLIYFSAHWCPPCRGFTPVLAKA